MKHKHLFSFGVLVISMLLLVACSKKERGPRLIVHVQEEDGTPAAGASVHAWYGQNAGTPGHTLNEILMDQTTATDGAGDAIFDFKFSAVLDVDVIYYKNYLDTLLNPVTDTLIGHRVVKIEEVRQKSSENNYRETVEVK
ncbi:MAG: hypothetical protein CO118_08625 [Flavobacteriales bacterium CG_4_9_14_3_um_filter_32_8]|nr:MAG: hypothetical protein CO118_08625 [Flavobacteriales bacterium CG_4_9_14_3_um_filter_32_8]